VTNYYRVMLGAGSAHAAEAFEGAFIGADFGIEQDIGPDLDDDFRAFNTKYIPIYLAGHPDKTKIGAGLACGFLWTVGRGIALGDRVLCPDGSGHYRVGEVIGPYAHTPNGVLPHRRAVKWLDHAINRADMTPELKRATGSIGTVANVSGYAEEIERLLGETSLPTIVATDSTIENPSLFAMEKHLEDFLVDNWAHTELGKQFEIYSEDGNPVGQQYPSDTGPIDILAISKDKKTLLVIELKKGRTSDVVVGQTLRYMGFVQEALAEKGQSVRGAVIALEDDKRLRRALAMVPTVSFYRYQISFKLVKS
jgi:restriction system protein